MEQLFSLSVSFSQTLAASCRIFDHSWAKLDMETQRFAPDCHHSPKPLVTPLWALVPFLQVQDRASHG